MAQQTTYLTSDGLARFQAESDYLYVGASSVYGIDGEFFNGKNLPLFKPPYSRITAIDLNTGEHAWMRPNGDGDLYRNHPMLRELDLPPLGGEGRGGPVLTKTLLVSALTAGGTDGGPAIPR